MTITAAPWADAITHSFQINFADGTPTLWGNEVTYSFDIDAFNPQVQALADGTFILAWQSGPDLFARHLNEFGSFTGGNFMSTVSLLSTRALLNPFVVQQADGSVVVTYSSEVSNPPLADHDIHRHSPSPPFTPGFVTTTLADSTSDEVIIDATALATGGMAYVYQQTPLGGSSTSLTVRFLNNAGSHTSGQITIDPGGPRIEQNPALAKLGIGGNVMVAYETFNSGNSARDIRLHTFSPAGVDLSGDVIVSAANMNAAFPDLAALEGPGSLTQVVTWQQNDGIAFRRYFGGLPLDANPIVIPNSLGFAPKITALKDGGFIIAWTAIVGTESDGSPELDIVLQRFSHTGAAIGSHLVLDQNGDQGLFGLNLTTLDDGRVVVAYVDETGNATNITTLSYQIIDPRDATISGSSDNDTIVGREDGSRIDGFGGNDKIAGRGAVDTLIGGLGNDTLNGGGGADFLLGGDGDDTYHVDNALDLVDEDVVFAGYGHGGFDTIISHANWYWDVHSVAERMVIAIDASDPGGAGTTIIGGIFNNEMVGNAWTNILFGRGGSDTYRAGDGVDFISLSTLGLNDSNAYAGVNGSNTVVVEQRTSGPFSYDIVFAFESGKDKFDVSAYGYASGNDVLAHGVNDGNGNVYFALGDGLDYLYVVGLTKAQIDASDFIL